MVKLFGNLLETYSNTKDCRIILTNKENNMIKEDEFVVQGQPETAEAIWSLRRTYRSLPKTFWKKMDRQNIKDKHRLSFEDWWAFVGEGIRQGRAKFDLHATKAIELDAHADRVVDALRNHPKKNYNYLKVIDYYQNYETPKREVVVRG
jgi:hypothetical protein